MNIFWKDLFRTIGHSIGRFLAIAGICALGVGFFGGLQMTCGSMKGAITDYYNDTNMMDIRIICSLGIDQTYIDDIKNIEEVEGVMPSYETDILTNFGNEQSAVRVHSLPDNLDVNDSNYINQQILARGQWPKNADECVLSEDAVLPSPPQIGDVIDILDCSTGLDKTLSVKQFKIVGFVHSSYYVGSVQMGQTNLGKGNINQFAYVPQSAFANDFPYTEVFVTVKDVDKFVTGSPEYQSKIDEVMSQLVDASPREADIRSAHVKDEAQKQIDEAQTQIDANENLLDEKYQEFNAYRDYLLGLVDEGINTANATIDKTNTIKNQASANFNNLEAANAKVESFETSMAGLLSIINETNKAVEINNSLANLVESSVVKQQIDELNAACKYFAEYCQSFYSALQFAYSVDVYNYYIGNYSTLYEGLRSVLPLRNVLCDSIIGKCNDVINNELLPQRNTIITKFNEQEGALIDGELQLSLAKLKLQDSQSQLDALNAKILIMDRTKNIGSISFSNDADRIASIANVFPLIFFFVALLVALTSMTRMIEEERITIGTYKALGFSRMRISSKFILYGVISSFVGSAIGLLLLTQFLPYVIMFAYSIIYKLPIPFPMPFNWTIGTISILAGVLLTVIATLMAAFKSLRLVPARLMVPTAPKAGKRIFLEYIKPLWKILTFNWKITFRNMFLYKKRLFMTLIGVAGCTALLLTGFGLHDSISDIMVMQFDEIAVDNFKVTFEDSATQSDKDETINKINAVNGETTSTLIHEESVIATPLGHPNAPTIIAVPNNVDQFQQMRVMRNRTSQEQFILDDSGVYISEKLASLMQVNVGDNIVVYNQDLIGNAGDKEYSFTVAGIVENYIAHYIYMTPNVYKHYFEKDCIYNNLIAHSNLTGDAQQSLIDDVCTNKSVKTAFWTTANRDNFERMLQSVNMVVVILIVAAGLLAFVVLYNLININICERAREIATLKVLGSNKRETNMYINRETFVLSFLGSLLGLILGVIMEQFVILSAEVDMVMFGRVIHVESFVISLAITLVFTVLVSLFMRKKLFSISMVESLKSVE